MFLTDRSEDGVMRFIRIRVEFNVEKLCHGNQKLGVRGSCNGPTYLCLDHLMTGTENHPARRH